MFRPFPLGKKLENLSNTRSVNKNTYIEIRMLENMVSKIAPRSPRKASLEVQLGVAGAENHEEPAKRWLQCSKSFVRFNDILFQKDWCSPELNQKPPQATISLGMKRSGNDAERCEESEMMGHLCFSPSKKKTEACFGPKIVPRRSIGRKLMEL